MQQIFVQSTSVGGRAYAKKTTVTGAFSVGFDESLLAAKIGTLTTRTDDNTGTLTMNAGHGIVTGNRLDVYWTDAAGVVKCRRGMTVGTVATNSVPIDGGEGDVLPAAAFAIRAMVPKEVAFPLTGNNVQSIQVYGQHDGSSFVFTTSGNVTIVGDTIVTAGGAYQWYNGSGVANPMSGQTVAKVFLSHGNTGAIGQVRGDVVTN